jgi:hypothetical protein
VQEVLARLRDFYSPGEHSHQVTVTLMQTMKLREYQPPSVLTTLLDSLVISQHWVPPSAAQITDRSEFPSALQMTAGKAAAAADTWRAWLSYDGVRFFTGEMSLDLARRHGCPALRVNYYNDEGHLEDVSAWVRHADGKWQRCNA